MKVNKEQLEAEMKLWENLYNNYENLSVNILADVLAHYKKEDRKELIERVNNVLESVNEPIDGQTMFDSIKGDLESFERINDESSIAYRTLTWIKAIAEEENGEKSE